MADSLVSASEVEGLFQIIPDNVYRVFEVKVNVSREGAVEASMRIWISEPDGSTSLVSNSMDGLKRKALARYGSRVKARVEVG